MKRSATAKLHPIVESFCDTELELYEILKNQDLNDPLIRALLWLHEAANLGTRPAEEAFAAAEAAPTKAVEPNLYILFLVCWSDLSGQKGRVSEANSLLNRAKALLSQNTPPVIRASLLNAEGWLGGLSGNHTLFEKNLKKTLEVVPPVFPRRKMWVSTLSFLLAQQGRVHEIEMELNHTKENILSRIAHFVDAVERNCIEDALRLGEEIKFYDEISRNANPNPYSKAYENSKQVLELLLRLEKSGGILLSNEPQPNVLPALKVIHHLLFKETEAALSLARTALAGDSHPISDIGFFSYNLIRAELSKRNSEAARFLMMKRWEAGNKNYLDYFFLTRIELLNGNIDLAAQHYSELLKGLRQYKAHNRLDFELHLACEMTPFNFLQLNRHSNQTSFPKSEKKEFTAAQPIIQPGQGIYRCIGTSLVLHTIRGSIKQVAPLDIPILITGETGTGKEVVARAIHETSPRRAEPFVAINCGAIAESLLESELFGHVRGAFTGAEKARQGLFVEAKNGTLFLDEIGDISPRIQIALLRVLETGEVRPVGSSQTYKISCRILAATNAELEKRIKEGSFRDDLFFRLRRLFIHIPPLREHPQDIVSLAEHFLNLGRKEGVYATMSLDLKTLLSRLPWPGNIRELRNEIERMRFMNSDKLYYDVNDLDPRFKEESTDSKSLSSTKQTDGKDLTLSSQKTPTFHTNLDENFEELIKQSKSSLRRLDRLRQLFQKYRVLTRAEIIQGLRISGNTATSDLKALCKEGVIRKVEPGPSPQTHYFELKRDQHPSD